LCKLFLIRELVMRFNIDAPAKKVTVAGIDAPARNTTLGLLLLAKVGTADSYSSRRYQAMTHTPHPTRRSAK